MGKKIRMIQKQKSQDKALSTAINFIVKNNITVLCFFIFVSIPIFLASLGHVSWSDDHNYIDLWSVYMKKASPIKAILSPLAGKGGEHIAPVYWIYNYLVIGINSSPFFVHMMSVLFFILTAFVIYCIVREHYQDKVHGVLAGTLFLINYHTAFKGLFWNCIHSHVVNTFTGAVSILFFLRFVRTSNKKNFVIAFISLLITILNLENGWLFLAVLIMFAFYYYKKVSLKKSIIVALLLLCVVPVQLLFAFYERKDFFPMLYRLQQTKSLGEGVFNVNELLVKSTGVSQVYHSVIYNNLKEDTSLKEAVLRAIRSHEINVFKIMTLGQVIKLSAIILSTVSLFVFFFVFLARRIKKESRAFFLAYLTVFILVIVVFYRLDIANSIAVFSSIIIADFILSLLRDFKKGVRLCGIAVLVFYFFSSVLTWADKFDDCYKTAYYGLSRVVYRGPNLLYQEINKAIGHYARNGVIIFMHDYSMYHRTTGRERIGDMFYLCDFVCLHVKKFQNEFFALGRANEFKNQVFYDLIVQICSDSKNKVIKVGSLEEASEKIKKENIDVRNIDVVYVTKDYKVIKF